jgi:hypothetical protein
MHEAELKLSPTNDVVGVLGDHGVVGVSTLLQIGSFLSSTTQSKPIALI